MDTLIQKLRRHVTEAAGNPAFIHHDWFVKYHLNILEKIALELCDRHPDADRDIVLALVWIHDYAKILDKDNEHEEYMLEKGRDKMLELGFETEFTDKVISYLSTFEKKMEIDLRSAPIEVQIVSSADGAAHLVGPFWAIYFKENPTKSTDELMESNRVKLKKDWERKMVLPEVREAFQQRNAFVNEQAGNFPSTYLP
jgi:hypothetical protein